MPAVVHLPSTGATANAQQSLETQLANASDVAAREILFSLLSADRGNVTAIGYLVDLVVNGSADQDNWPAQWLGHTCNVPADQVAKLRRALELATGKRAEAISDALEAIIAADR